MSSLRDSQWVDGIGGDLQCVMLLCCQLLDEKVRMYFLSWRNLHCNRMPLVCPHHCIRVPRSALTDVSMLGFIAIELPLPSFPSSAFAHAQSLISHLNAIFTHEVALTTSAYV